MKFILVACVLLVIGGCDKQIHEARVPPGQVIGRGE